MPFVNNGDQDLYYEETGSGVPIIFLEGLGYSLWMWRYQREILSKWARCIFLDNRVVGKSSPHDATYSVEFFARDALFLMDTLKIKEFYVLGVSMGGFIAQELARIAPERVKGLILVSTSYGGSRSYPMPKAVYQEMTRSIEGESPEEKLRRVMALALTSSFPIDSKEAYSKIIVDRLESLQSEKQLVYQSMSSIGFDASEADSKLDIPAFVICGTDDKVLNWFNGLMLFKALKKPSLMIFHGQNHLLFMEKSEDFNRAVEAFVRSVENASYQESIVEVR